MVLAGATRASVRRQAALGPRTQRALSRRPGATPPLTSAARAQLRPQIFKQTQRGRGKRKEKCRTFWSLEILRDVSLVALRARMVVPKLFIYVNY